MTSEVAPPTFRNGVVTLWKLSFTENFLIRFYSMVKLEYGERDWRRIAKAPIKSRRDFMLRVDCKLARIRWVSADLQLSRRSNIVCHRW